MSGEAIHFAEHAIGPPPGPMGWDYERDWAEDQLARMADPYLRDTEYYQSLPPATEHRDIIPWTLEERVLGKVQRAHYQARGTCVSQGYARGVQFAAMVDMVVHNQGEEWLARVHPGSIYAFSRVEVGGGRISGDGSMGAWAAQAVMKYGVLYRIKYGTWDLSADQDELHSVQWGSRGAGVPNDLEPEAAKRKVAAASLVQSGDEYMACQYDWKPVPICSQQGFTTTRDQYGLCYPRGKWAHCMLAFGLLKIKHPEHPTGRLVAPIWQSWGNDNPSGPRVVTLQTGEQTTLPPGVFLVDVDVLDSRILPGRDSFALAGVSGWTAPLTIEQRARLVER